MKTGGLVCVFEDAKKPLVLGLHERLEPGDLALLDTEPALGEGAFWLPGYAGAFATRSKCQMPVVHAPGLRIRVLAGVYAGVIGALPWPRLCLDAYMATCAALPLQADEHWQVLHGEVVKEQGQLRALRPSHVLVWSGIAENTNADRMLDSISCC
ncbi:hypothetical protein [Chitinolyticbacter albus]|uniref:hypothetical protein n=1 Tax=Chitinolyticbacter albus TaxID=2961951 RepID=UPI00210B28E0|nr:hypothetical protein [Chitinolyticbacter albus]